MMDLRFSQESGDCRERNRAVSLLLMVLLLDGAAGGFRYLADSFVGVIMMTLIKEGSGLSLYVLYQEAPRSAGLL